MGRELHQIIKRTLLEDATDTATVIALLGVESKKRVNPSITAASIAQPEHQPRSRALEHLLST
jgi:hypothetical protein